MSNQELLECIAPYLPYNVKGFFLFNGKKESQIVSKSKTLDLRTVAFYMENSDHIYFKPILRPLSDLTKPCLEGGNVPIEELEEKIGHRNWCEAYSNAMDALMEDVHSIRLVDLIKRMPYEFIVQLFKWHFDVFGLIEKSYAIDINTLKVD